jgi:cytochrome c biogenesis protein CcdA/thiol-disulfide isomerase/thioredoxin
MLLFVFIAFVSGILTIFSPCVWPILPVVLSSSLNKSALYAFSLTLGIVSMFTTLVLGFSFFAKIFQVSLEFFRFLSFLVIFISGLIMIFPQIQRLFEAIFKISINKTYAVNESLATKKPRRFNLAETMMVNCFSGFLTGASLGVLWTPCAGPILVTIAMLTANQIVNAFIIIILISYALGTAFPIFLLVLAEQWLFTHQQRLTKLTRTAQVATGIMMIISSILIYSHYDKIIWLKISPFLPFVPKNINQLEEIEPVQKQLNQLKQKTKTSLPTPTTIIYISPSPTPPISVFPKAPEITGIVKWFNTENNSPIFLKNLRGKVVLLDFWTYTCVPCIPNIDYLKDLAQKYQNQGLIVISIHTPGYAEAKLETNVKAAIDRYQVSYPVAMDNDWKTFDAYKNNYWPTEFLIDRNGNIRFRHEGGGEHEKVEEAVIELLNLSS